MTEISDQSGLELTAHIVAAYVSNNPVPVGELPALIHSVSQSLLSTAGGEPAEQAPEKQKPAVPIKKSITPDYIISLEDGQRFKSMKRALKVRYGMTPDEYRAKWGLPADYPMVAPNYSAARSELAKKLGLGTYGSGRSKVIVKPAKPQRKAKVTVSRKTTMRP